MRVKLIHAATMAEGMRRVRFELGEDALILGNRRIGNGVEIIAAIEPAIETAAPANTKPKTPPPPPQPAPAPAAPDPNWLDKMTRRALLLHYGALDWSKPVMLVGTPGAGKTLTAAKLAARLVRLGEKPMVITADRERAGASEQLAAFTRILELDLTVAEDPLMMARALASRPAKCKAIIDMAGCNPYDLAQKEALVTSAVTADASLVWVLPAGQDADDAAEMATCFASLGARQMIPTKLDISHRLEGILRAAEAGGFTLTDAGIGSGIIDGIMPLEAQDLIARLAAAASHFKARQAA
jgi:flagellar biosynthesis protein FlhF